MSNGARAWLVFLNVLILGVSAGNILVAWLLFESFVEAAHAVGIAFWKNALDVVFALVVLFVVALRTRSHMRRGILMAGLPVLVASQAANLIGLGIRLVTHDGIPMPAILGSAAACVYVVGTCLVYREAIRKPS